MTKYLILLTIYLLLSPYHCIRYNLFNCRNIDPWEVDYNESIITRDSAMMQDWLHAWQHNPWRCSQFGREEWVSQYGIGNGLLRVASLMERSLEFGMIYRPMKEWKWASNAKNCTYNMTTIECYMVELSSCRLNLSSQPLHKVDVMDRDDRLTPLGQLLGGSYTTVDICTLSKVMKKPMAWVAGHYLQYLLRPQPYIQQQIHDRIYGIFDTHDPTLYSTITVHYRGGRPDAYRKTFSLDVYMKVVKEKAKMLAASGRPVAVVYLASQNNIDIFKSVEYIHDRYGGNYSYKFLYPMSDNTTINSNEEIELQFDAHPDIPKEPVVIEFLADLYLMTNADVFIGSLSCIYWVAMLLRYAKHPNLDKLHTCFVDRDSKLVCEDNLRKKYEIFNNLDYWITGDIDSLKGRAETHIGAFEGGVPF